VGSVPQHDGQSRRVLAAWDGHGLRAAWLVPGATDREVFWRFVQQGFGPRLPAGAVVVRDHWAVQKGAAVEPTVRRVGAQRYYWPPSSPDDNPIELAGSKIKTWLPGLGARPDRKWYRSLQTTWTSVTAQEAEAWFAHGGDPLH
jgi:hypothetical protein